MSMRLLMQWIDTNNFYWRVCKISVLQATFVHLFCIASYIGWWLIGYKEPGHDEIVYIICTRFCFKSCTLACKILDHNCLTDQRWLLGASAHMYPITTFEQPSLQEGARIACLMSLSPAHMIQSSTWNSWGEGGWGGICKHLGAHPVFTSKMFVT